MILVGDTSTDLHREENIKHGVFAKFSHCKEDRNFCTLSAFGTWRDSIAFSCLFGVQSPLSMKVTFRELQEGLSLTLQDALKMEFRLSQRFMQDSDFYEGVTSGQLTLVLPCTLQ